jgi:uncharacterized protein YbjT (DUF2867 family)
MSYLITGATGSIGRQIIQQLQAMGEEVSALSRRPDHANLPTEVKIFGGDLTKGQIQAGAFEGVKSVFLFPADGDVGAFLDKAKAANIEHIVVLSSLAVAAEHRRDLDSASYRHHKAIEQAVEASGLAYTFLRPGSFANNLRFWSYSIKTSGTVYGPYPQSAQSLIHEADIAAVAVTILTMAGGHIGAKYALTGPQSLTQTEQLRTIGGVIGRELTYQVITPEQFKQSMSAFMPEDIIKQLLDYWSDTVDQPDIVRPTFEQLTGRAGRTLAEWATDHRAEFL